MADYQLAAAAIVCHGNIDAHFATCQRAAAIV
jgi:hypothetical protein